MGLTHIMRIVCCHALGRQITCNTYSLSNMFGNNDNGLFLRLQCKLINAKWMSMSHTYSINLVYKLNIEGPNECK